MLNPWVLIGVGIIWALSVFGVGKWQYRVGQEHERVMWQARENAALQAANVMIRKLNDEARALEDMRVKDMAKLSEAYTKESNNAEARRRADVAAARDGALVLRIPSSACSGGGEAAPSLSSSGGGHGGSTIELPRTVTADLFALANDADQVADQLRACQSVIIADRKESP